MDLTDPPPPFGRSGLKKEVPRSSLSEILTCQIHVLNCILELLATLLWQAQREMVRNTFPNVWLQKSLQFQTGNCDLGMKISGQISLMGPCDVIKDQKYENPREIFENPDPVAQEKPALQIWTPNSVWARRNLNFTELAQKYYFCAGFLERETSFFNLAPLVNF